LNSSLSDSCVTSDHAFQMKDIKHTNSKFKPIKCEGLKAVQLQRLIMLLMLAMTLCVKIAFLFTLVVVHGSVPDCLLSRTIILIAKGHNANVSVS